MSKQTNQTNQEKTKTLHLVSLGCTKNLVDSEIMLGALGEHKIIDAPEAADLIIINTCGFIDSAKQESIAAILDASQRRKKGALLIVSGCLSERYRDELQREIPEIDIITGVGDYDKIAQMVAQKKGAFSPGVYLQSADTARVITGSKLHAYIKLSEGCNQQCSFCAIPQFKGKLVSRSVDSVLKEMRRLAAQGFVDFSFVAQDSSSYLRDLGAEFNHGRGLISLISRVDAEFGDSNITARILYLYPTSTSAELVGAIAASKVFVPYFDMPIQHIAEAMLARMRRGSSKASHIALLESMRAVPNSFVRSTIIVGHPGETEAEFNELAEFLENFAFDRLNIFEFSPQENTASYDMETVDAKVVAARIKRLDKILKKQEKARNLALIDSVVEVFVERRSELSEHFYSARPVIYAPDIDGEVLINDVDENLAKSFVANSADRRESSEASFGDNHQSFTSGFDSAPQFILPPGRYTCQITECKDGLLFGKLLSKA